MSKNKRLELPFQDRVIKYLTDNKIWHIRYTASTTFGIPDIICIKNGVFIGLELKRPDGKGKSSALQKLTVQSIIDAGGLAKAEIETIEEIEELLSIAETKTIPK